jgi:hypothetical protein
MHPASRCSSLECCPTFSVVSRLAIPGALLVSVRRQGFTTGLLALDDEDVLAVERPSSNLMPTVRPELRVLRTTERPQRAASNSEAPRTDPRFEWTR